MTLTTERRIHDEIIELVEQGAKLMAVTRGIRRGDLLAGDQLAEFSSWMTRLGQTIRRVFGTDSQHFESFQSQAQDVRVNAVTTDDTAVAIMAGIARAMQSELEAGYIPQVRSLVRADVFADFLEMADYLLEEGYKDAAAVITGAVLEDSLRQLCDRVDLPLSAENGHPLALDSLNANLRKADLYDKLIQKQITGWADLRNSAAHGHFDKYDAPQVRMMLDFVLKFVSDMMR